MTTRLGLALGAWCVLVASSAHGGEAPKLGAQARAILFAHCASCHGGGQAAKGGFAFVLDRDLLVNRLLVTPGRANQSDLFLRIQNGEMPPKSRKLRLNPAELKTLKQWIDAGAPAFEETAKAARKITPAETIQAILTDLETIDPRRRRFTRYLTLGHLTLAGRPGGELQRTQEAAAKLINSLSWHARITKPDFVNPDGTILRLDLRAYKWSAAQWEKLVSAYPYRLQTSDENKTLAKLTGSEFPALRADWFVATAARPPFYHDLLQLPVTDRALERLLQVDVAADLQDDNVMRAGFNDSGVSKNNRLLERHDAAYGVFWRSYDFAGNAGRQNLFENPVGPNAGATSFQPAGGEMIFHLPNGLQAYLLVDGKGRRIDKGPTEIVADPRRPDQRVETGISCMSCHARGLLFKADQLRGHVEKNAQVFGKAIVDAVRATHPRKARFQAQIEEDNARYLKALEKFGVRDPDHEPVNLVTQRFEGTLDGPGAAAELGLEPGEFARFLKHEPDKARIFGSLLVKGGTSQRTVFQEHFPELARRVLAWQTTLIAKARPKIEPTFEGHTATVNAIAFSSDGTKAASGSDDGTVRVWAVPSGRLLATLGGMNNAEVFAVAFSTDGKYLLSGGSDRLLRLWDLQTQKPIRSMRGHTGSIRAVAFSPDGKRAVTGGDDRSLRIWNLGNGEETFTLEGHTGPITSVVWSSKDGYLLSGSRDGTARWWHVASRKQRAVLEGHAGPVLCVALAPDRKSALTGGNDQIIRLWDLTTGKERHGFKGHVNAVVQVQFLPNGRDFSSSSSQHRNAEPTWRRWSTAARKEIGSRELGSEHSFGSVSFSPDGRRVLVGGPGGFLRIWAW